MPLTPALLRRFSTAALAVLLATCGSPAPTSTAITGVTVIDAVHGAREGRTVVFDGDEVLSVLPSREEFVAGTTIDGRGKFLIPGLWDFHVHLTFDDRFTDAMPALFLAHGVTSVRDTGGLMRKMLPVVERMRAPGAMAPRVFFAGPLLDGEPVVYDGVSRPEIGVGHATPEEARATVRELARRGVDFIKIYEMVRPEVFRALVRAARELGLPIDSHVPLSMRAGVAGAEVDSMEHLRNVETDCVENAAEWLTERQELLENPEGLAGADLRAAIHERRRLPAIAAFDPAACERTLTALTSTTQVPTLRLVALRQAPPYERDDWPAALSGLPTSVQGPWNELAAAIAASPIEEPDVYAEWALATIGRMHERGIPIAAGTDTPILLAIPGYSLHSELEYLVRAGLSPLDALAAATLRPAEWFSIEDRAGSIAPGMQADMVLLNGDPLADIRNTREISIVVSRGRTFEPSELR